MSKHRIHRSLPLALLALVAVLSCLASHHLRPPERGTSATHDAPPIQIIARSSNSHRLEATNLVYEERGPQLPTLLHWFPDWQIAQGIPVNHRATLTLYRGPAHADLSDLTPVDFIEPDLPIMPTRFLYALEPLAADQRYYLASTADWKRSPDGQFSGYTHLQYSTVVQPGGLGGFSISTLQDQELNLYHDQLYFVSDYQTLHLQLTPDAERLNTTETLWFSFQVTTEAAPTDSDREYRLTLPDFELQISTIGNASATATLTDFDLTDYLYPDFPPSPAKPRRSPTDNPTVQVINYEFLLS